MKFCTVLGNSIYLADIKGHLNGRDLFHTKNDGNANSVILTHLLVPSFTPLTLCYLLNILIGPRKPSAKLDYTLALPVSFTQTLSKGLITIFSSIALSLWENSDAFKQYTIWGKVYHGFKHCNFPWNFNNPVSKSGLQRLLWINCWEFSE